MFLAFLATRASHDRPTIHTLDGTKDNAMDDAKDKKAIHNKRDKNAIRFKKLFACGAVNTINSLEDTSGLLSSVICSTESDHTIRIGRSIK
jgi:hypothetical protein